MFFYRNPLKWVQDQKLVAIDPNLPWDSFGREVAISADAGTVVVGNYTDGENAGTYDYNGSFYIFKKDGDQYSEAHRFMGSETGLYLGTNPIITADGSKVAIGASGDDTLAVDAGAIHIYESGSGGYVETQKILLGDTDPAHDWVGYPDIRFNPTGEFLFVSSLYDDDTGQTGGAVYILQSGSNGYQQIQKITSEDSSIFALGSAIEISEDKQTLIVCAKGTTIGTDVIQVYESGSNGYELSQNLSFPLSYGFGDLELKINQDKTRIVARAFGVVSGVYVGDIVIFEKNQGSYELVQQISDNSGDGFYSLQLNSAGDMFAVGAIGYDNNGLSYAGGVLIYESGSNGFENVQTLTGGTTDVSTGGARFGMGVAMNPEGTEIIVGAPSDETNGFAAGAAFYFKKVGTEFQLVQQLSSSSDWSPEGDLFGFRVQCAADDLTKLFVSALYDEQEGVDYIGSIYVFEEIEGQYVQVQVIEVPPEIYSEYAFMQPIAVSSDGTRLLTSNNTNKWAVFESGSGGYSFLQQLPIDKAAYTSGPANVGSFVGNDKIFFGSYGENEAYVFHSGSGGYQLVQTLTASYDTTGASEALANRGFGVSLFADAIGDLVFVGALNDDENGTPNAGAVYVFQSSSLGYNQVQKLTASFNTDGTPESSPQGDQFGSQISITPDGRVIAISAINDDENGESAGSVYIYESGSTGYQQIQKITASADSDPSSDYFGFSISLDSAGETLVVGAVNDDAAGGDNTMFSGAGSVYIFKFDGSSFKQQEKLLPTEEPNPEANLFGYSLFLDKTGTRLIIGSTNDEENGGSNDAFSSAGSAYIYKLTRDY